MAPAPILRALRVRAELMARARAFFAERGVLEVDTPTLGDSVVVEAQLDPIRCRVDAGSGRGAAERFLLCSPEGPMKRLLAAGSGPIYQFAHAFRDGEVGRRHRPEFAMLEWYRPGFDHLDLMAEVEAFVQTLLPDTAAAPFLRCSYRDLFMAELGVDPFATSVAELRGIAAEHSIDVPPGFDSGTVDDALDLLLVMGIEPRLGSRPPIFLYDYPASQAALARVATDAQGNSVGRRFELYVAGVELVNGYHELADAAEQRLRFERANDERRAQGRDALPIDEALLAALEGGFPDCAGVALGFDRLLMLAIGTDDIGDVTSS